jgi:uncharacterized protein YoaH (UPF0181 family)
MALNMSPSQLDPVFAADTPITPDPPVRAAARPQTTKPRYDQSHRDRVAELVAQGYSPAEATALAARELARAHIDSHATPPSPPPAPPAPTPPDMEPMTAQQLRDMGYNPYTEPGVNMPDGSKAEGPQQLMNEREAAAYNVRTPNGPGWYNPSGRDKAMMARGYVPVTNQDGTVSYRLGPGGEVDGLPGTPGRGGRRDDLEAQMLKADGTPMVDGQGNAIPRFRVDNMSGPLSENNSVYVQSNEARAKQAAYRRERQLYRDAEIQGVSPAALLAANPGDYGDLTAGGQRDRVGARAANEGARQAAADKREAQWRSQMMLAGRNPAKNAVNAYNALNDPNTNDWQRAVMANALRPDMDNTTPLTVDAMGAKNAMRFINSTNLGAGNNANNPLVQQAIRDKAIERADALIKKYPRGWDGMYEAADVKAGEVKTLDGEEVEITVQNGKVSYGNAAVVATDISTSNGVIHEIDTVVVED